MTDEKTAKTTRKKTGEKPLEQASMSPKRKKIIWEYVILLPMWTYGSFLLATVAINSLLSLIALINKDLLPSINQVQLMAIVSVLTYALAITIAVGVPQLIKLSKKTTLKEVGVPDLPAWMDIFLSVPAYIVYMVLTMVVVFFSQKLFPDLINLNQSQNLPFSTNMIYSRIQVMTIFLTLAVLAPVAEELLFRGYLHGKLRKIAPAWLTIAVTGLTFGLAHLWSGPGTELQWTVMLDTIVLGVVLSILREATGAIWAGVLVHSIKNGIAFYFLFINPIAIEQIKTAVLLLM